MERREAGRALLFTLNRDHVAAPAVEALAELRAELVRRIAEVVGGWGIQPLHVALFGSFARGDGDEQSDVDIFVVRPSAIGPDATNWRGQLDALADSVLRWSGNHAGISEVSEDEVARLHRESPPIVDQLRADAIVVVGPDVRALLAGAA